MSQQDGASCRRRSKKRRSVRKADPKGAKMRLPASAACDGIAPPDDTGRGEASVLAHCVSVQAPGGRVSVVGVGSGRAGRRAPGGQGREFRRGPEGGRRVGRRRRKRLNRNGKKFGNLLPRGRRGHGGAVQDAAEAVSMRTGGRDRGSAIGRRRGRRGAGDAKGRARGIHSRRCGEAGDQNLQSKQERRKRPNAAGKTPLLSIG